MDRPSSAMRAHRSFGRTLIGGIILALTFGGALAGGALLHANVRPARRLAARVLSDVLTSTFSGRITIQKIDHIDAGGFDGADATVDDPSGARVLTVFGLRGRSSLVEIARQLTSGSRSIEIDIPHARAERAEATIVEDDEGIPTVARAFEPRPAANPTTSSGPGKRVRVWLPEVELHKVKARGGIAGLKGLDVELANVNGSVLAGTDRTSIRVRRFSLQAGGLESKPAQGTAELRIEVPSSTGNEVSVWGVFDGNVGDVQVNLRGGLDGRELYFTGDALRAQPEAVRAFLPWWPILDDTKLHVQARGEPSNLFMRGSVHVGAGNAEFAGQLSLDGGIRTHLAVEARDIDLRSFAKSAPPTAISTSATVNLGVDGAGDLAGSVVAKTEPFRIATLDVPPASVTTTIAGSRVVGKVELHDRALTSVIDVDVHPGKNDGPVVVDLDWTGRAPAMERVPWLEPIGKGELAWRAKGSIVEGRLSASVDGTTLRYARPGVALAEGRINGTVRGPFDALAIDANLEGTSFHVGPLAFSEVRAKAEGPLTRLQVVAAVSGADSAKLGVRASVETSPGGTVVRNVELAAARGEIAVFGKVRSIAVTGDRVDLQGISVEGAGAPIAGSLSISPVSLKARLAAADVDLTKMGAILLPGAAMGGRLAFDVDTEITGRTERGHARLRLEDGQLGEIKGLTAHGEADVSAGHFSGGVDVVWGALGTATITTTDATLAGSALRASSWENARGKVQMDSAVDLTRLREQFAVVARSLGEAAGAARAKIVLSRVDEAEADESGPKRIETVTPDVDLLFWTDGLRVGRTSDGVDVQLALHADGDEPIAQLTARLVDTEGIFAALSASSADVRWADFWGAPERALDRLLRLPLTAEVVLPRRNLAVYPAALRLAGWHGDVEGAATLSGSLRAPLVAVSVQGHAVDPSNAGLGLPVDVDAQARYDGEKALARLRASRPEGVVFDASTQIDARLEKVFAAISSPPPAAESDDETAPAERADARRSRGDPWWEATGRARLYQFPLASVPLLSENVIGGFASGMLTFRSLNRDPQIDAEIEATNLALDAAIFPAATAHLRVAKDRVVVSAKLDQKVGGASATAAGRVEWNSPLIPELDKKEPVDLFVEARDLRAAALYPFLLRDIFSHFDGRLNGTMHLRQGGAAADFIDGAFDLQDGSMLVPEIGQEFRKASAHIAVVKRGEIEISNVSANGVSGRLTASGKMLLKGLRFENAEGEVRIAQREAIPLTLEGVSVGDAWGTLMLHAKMANDHTVKLDVDVPVFHADMPESSSRDVQGLAENPEIQVGVRRDGQQLVPVLLAAPEETRAEDALAWQVTFYLGQDVALRRGSMMQLVLGGQPVVTLTDKARVNGEIELRSGTVEVFGKRFEIEHGTAQFEGDEPGNPNVAVTARWDAPDGTHIYADYVGPLRTGRLSMRSEPVRSQSDVVAMLLFGTSDDSVTLPAAGSTYWQQRNASATAGTVLAGGAVSTNINRVLASVTPLDVTTRVTSDAQSPMPEVAVRLSPRVTAMVSYRTRVPMQFEKQDRMLVTLDWRFRRNWSIATTIGDRGGSVVDMIWKYRY
jgi:translocation and assembly module TamB